MLINFLKSNAPLSIVTKPLVVLNIPLSKLATPKSFCVMPVEGSRYNQLHAAAVRNLCLYFRDQNLIKDISSVGVATPYSIDICLS